MGKTDKDSIKDLINSDELDSLLKKSENIKEKFQGTIVVCVMCIIYSVYFFCLSFGFFSQSAVQILVNCLAIFPLFSIGFGTLLAKLMLLTQDCI